MIIPAYNAERTIVRAAESALVWEGDDLELIVVDDGSTDSTPQLVDALATRDCRVRVIHQANAGRSVARNVGTAAARGVWVMYLDADDYLIDSALRALREALGSDASLVVFPMARSNAGGTIGYSNVTWVEGEPVGRARQISVGELRDYMLEASRVVPEVATSLSLVEPNSSCSRLYRREQLVVQAELMDGTGPFPPGLRFSEDRLMNLGYLAVAEGGQVLLSGWPLYFWDLGESSTTAKAHPDDALGLPRYRDAVDDLVEGGLLSPAERSLVLAREVMNQLSRVERLTLREFGYAARAWREVLSDHDFRNCLGALYLGGNGWGHFVRWVPARFFVAHGAPVAAIIHIRVTAAAKRVVQRLTRKGAAR